MRELALNVLDITENSVKAGADLIEISVIEVGALMTITIADNGCGMDAEFAARVTDPFTTTRTTRKVGLGVPLFKMAAEQTGGEFSLVSEQGKGTEVTATFHTDHIDCMPLGSLGGTMSTLLAGNPHIRYVLTYSKDGTQYVFDTQELKDALGDYPLDDVEILSSVEDMIDENINEIKNGGF